MNEEADEIQQEEDLEENPAENTQSVPNQTQLETGKDSQHNKKPNDNNQPSQTESEANQQNENEMKEPNEKDESEANNSDKNYVENMSSNQDAQLSERQSQQAKKSQQNETNKRAMGMRNENRQLAEETNEKDKKIRNFNVIDQKMDSAAELAEEKEKNEKKEEMAQTQEDFRHIQETETQFDEKIFDAATEQQKQKQKKPTEFNEMNHEEENETNKGSRNKRMKNDEAQDLNDKIDKLKQSNQQQQLNQEEEEIAHKMDESKEEEHDTKLSIQDDEMQLLDTKASIYLSSIDNLLNYTDCREIVEKNLEKFRQLIKSEQQLSTDLISQESHELWQDYELLTQQMSKELCEQLRLILEPTICSKLKGDYKSGKRLNMKRVIEYIATEYRKDKIWLRRIKPNKRDYQVMLAIDNSSSMSDNHCIQLAYETIATLANAFNYLEGK